MRKRFQDNGPERYGVDSSNPTTPKTPFYVVQRIISTLAGVQGGTSFVTVKSVANRDVAAWHHLGPPGGREGLRLPRLDQQNRHGLPVRKP